MTGAPHQAVSLAQKEEDFCGVGRQRDHPFDGSCKPYPAPQVVLYCGVAVIDGSTSGKEQAREQYGTGPPPRLLFPGEAFFSHIEQKVANKLRRGKLY